MTLEQQRRLQQRIAPVGVNPEGSWQSSLTPPAPVQPYPANPSPVTSPTPAPAPTEGSAPSASTPSASTPTATEQGISGWDDILANSERERQAARDGLPSQKEIEEEDKRYRRQALFSSISDLIGGLANVYFATKGAAPVQTADHASPVLDKWERVRAERRQRLKEFNDIAQRASALRQQRADWLYGRQRDEAEQRRKDAEQQRKERETEARAEQIAARIANYEAMGERARAQALKAQAEAEFTPRLMEANIAANRARVASAARSGGGNSAKWFWADEEGNEHYAMTKDEAYARASAAGTIEEFPVTNVTTRQTVDRYGNVHDLATEYRKPSPRPGVPKKQQPDAAPNPNAEAAPNVMVNAGNGNATTTATHAPDNESPKQRRRRTGS